MEQRENQLNNKLNPHKMASRGIEPGSEKWEASCTTCAKFESSSHFDVDSQNLLRMEIWGKVLEF